MSILVIGGGGGGGTGPRGPKGDRGEPGPGADQSLNIADAVTFNSLTLAGEAVIVSGIANAGDGYIQGIMGWGNPAGTQWSDLNGTYVRTSVAVRPLAFSDGKQGMHTPASGTFNYYLANPVSQGVPNPNWNGIAYFLAPGNRSGWGDPNNDSQSDPPVNYWRLVVGDDWPYTYFTNPSSDAQTFPLAGWVPVSAEAPTPNEGAGGQGANYLPNYDGGFAVADAGGSGLTFVNGTQVTVGTYDNAHGGNGGLSLICAVGYELNWQAGRLRSSNVYGPSGTPQTIYCDSPLYVVDGSDTTAITGAGVVFPDETTQASAGITSVVTGVTGASRVTNCMAISQADYDALASKDGSTLYVIT